MGYGLFIDIDHQNGYVTRYEHLSAVGAPQFSPVSKGQIIGTNGNTGNSSGPHLHFEVLHNGAPVDPYGGGGMPWLWLSSVESRSQLTGQPQRVPKRKLPICGASYCLISSYWFQATRCGVLVDQNGTSDGWLSLGAFDFGTWPNAPYLGVWISDKTGEDYAQTDRNQLGIDALRFRAPPPVFVPIVGRV